MKQKLKSIIWNHITNQNYLLLWYYLKYSKFKYIYTFINYTKISIYINLKYTQPIFMIQRITKCIHWYINIFRLGNNFHFEIQNQYFMIIYISLSASNRTKCIYIFCLYFDVIYILSYTNFR